MGTLEEPVNNKIVEQPTVSTAESVKTNETIVDKPTNNDDEVRFSGKVTPEQELSASVARRRRDISKKRSASVGRPRDQTPVRALASDDETQVNEVPNLPPKTPERRNKSRSSRKTSLETTDVGTDPAETKTNAPNERSKSKSTRIGTPDSVDRSSRQSHASAEEPSTPTGRSKSKSTRKTSNETPENQPDSTERLGRPTHVGAGEIISSERSKSKTSRKPSNETPEEQSEKTKSSRQASFEGTETGATEQNDKSDTADKPPKSASADEISTRAAKSKLSDSSKEKSARLRKDVRKVAIKRSQSAPRAKIEDICPPDETDLVESFKKAQQISADFEKKKPEQPIISESPKVADAEHFSTALEAFPTPEKKPVRPTSIPIVSNILRRRQLEESEIQVVEDDSEEIVEVKKPIVKLSKRYSLREIWQRWKSFKLEYSHHYKKIISMRNRCLNDIGLLMIFCGLGALMFKFTEGSFENFYKCGVKRVKRNFIDDLWRFSHHLREEDWKSMARNKLRDFEEQLHSAHEAGVTSYSGQRSWSFLNAVVYALTVVTTIGYGHMYPTTTTGRALTIIYAIIGIPLFLIILTDFGKLFTRAIKFLWAFVRRLYYTGTCKQARKNTAMQEVMKGAQMMYDIATFRRPSQYNLDEENGGVPGPPTRFPAVQPQPYPMTLPVAPRSRDGDTDPPTTPAPSTFEIDDEFNLPISVAIFLLLGYIFLGAVVYYMWEKWDFFASFYFVFISMSTIGFGDYVPRHPICMIVSIIYLVFGLALMSMCINVVQVKISDTFKQASAKLGATIGLRVAEEDGSIATMPPPAIEIADVHTTAAKTV